MEYLRSYSYHHKLRRHITFNTRVEKVTKAQDFMQSGRWVVHTKLAKSSLSLVRFQPAKNDTSVLCTLPEGLSDALLFFLA